MILRLPSYDVSSYPLLVALRTCSSLIIWIDFTLIFSLLSYFWHASPANVGMASALYGLPGLFLGPFFGRLADRQSTVLILNCSYIARGLTSLFLILAPSMEIFVSLVFLKGIANLGAMPAEQVLTRSLLNKEQIISNAGLMTAIDQITKICAPLFGALMAQWLFPSTGFVASAALSAAGLVLLCILRIKNANLTSNASGKNQVSKLNALFVLLKQDQLFRVAFSAAIIQSVVLGLYDPLLALLLKERGFPAGTFGVIVSCTAAGGLIGALIFRHIFRRQGGLRIIAPALVGFGMTIAIPGLLILLSVDFSFYLMCGLWIANGAFYGLAAMSFAVIMQTQCPLETIGVVSSSARSVQLSALVLGPLLGAILAQAASLGIVFVLSGTLAMAWGINLTLSLYRLHLNNINAPSDAQKTGSDIAPD